MNFRKVTATVAALLFATLGLLAFVCVGGCTAQQQQAVQKAEVNLAQGADQGITFSQQQLTLAQSVAAAYQAQLAALPPGDKSTNKLLADFGKAQAEVAKWQVYLTLAKIGIRVVEAQTPPPATAPAP